VDQNLEAAKETCRVIEAEGGTGIPFVCDVTSSGECQKMVEACLAAFGRVDVLPQQRGGHLSRRAGGTGRRTVGPAHADQRKEHVPHVQAHAAAHGAARWGRDREHRLDHAIRSLPAIAIAYAASKAAVIALTREIAVQYAAKGIRATRFCRA